MCMTIRENKFELLSAFLDGEKLSDEQLLELMGDEEVMAKWDEYTFQRAVVRDELPKGVDMKSFSEGLVSRLAQEPQYISIAVPAAGNVQQENRSQQVDQADIYERKAANASDFWGSLGRLAVAATIACICVFGVQYLPKDNNSDFNENSISTSNMSIAPVSNTLVSDDNGLKLDIDNTGKTASVIDKNIVNEKVLAAADNISAQQAEQYKQKKINEVNTLEALLNDHDSVRRKVSQEK